MCMCVCSAARWAEDGPCKVVGDYLRLILRPYNNYYRALVNFRTKLNLFGFPSACDQLIFGQIFRRIAVKNYRRRGVGAKNRENLATSEMDGP